MDPIDLILTILGAAGGTGVIIAGLSAWLGTVWANRIAAAQKQALQIVTEIDLDLRKRRSDLYQELWEATAILPKWPRAEDVTYEELREFSKTLRTWYFQKGGLYLSCNAHEQGYSPLQDALMELLTQDFSGKLSEEHYDSIREKCSSLRSKLTEDIESRREGPL